MMILNGHYVSKSKSNVKLTKNISLPRYCDNRGEVCQGGYCVREDETCSSRNRRGYCRRRGEYCDDGVCVEDRSYDDDDRFDSLRGDRDRPCSRSNRRGFCRARGDVCRDGECVRSGSDNNNDDRCSRDNRNG